MGVKHPEFVLAAAVVCWVLGSLLSWVIRTYNMQAQRAQLMRLLQEPEEANAAEDE